METAIGVFAIRDRAEEAVKKLREQQVPKESIIYLTRSESEAKSIGKELGAYTGGFVEVLRDYRLEWQWRLCLRFRVSVQFLRSVSEQPRCSDWSAQVQVQRRAGAPVMILARQRPPLKVNHPKTRPISGKY
jgi:hypothetical protein